MLARRRVQPLLLLLLGVAGYVLVGWWVLRWDPSGARLRMALSRDDAVELARRFAASRDSVPRPRAYARLDGRDELDQYFRVAHVSPAERASVERLAPAVSFLVILIDPAEKHRMEIQVSSDGRILGYRELDLTPAAGGDADRARIQATEAFNRRMGGDAGSFRYLGSRVITGGKGATQRFEWNRQVQPDLELEAIVDVGEGRVIAEEIKAAIDPDFRRRHIAGADEAIMVFSVVVWTSALLITCYSIFRYAARVREREVPHARALLLLAVFAVGAVLTGFVLNDDNSIALVQAEARGAIAPGPMPLLGALTFFSVVIAITWGGCEGDVRERFPGKLTSVDALLSGKLASSNVARAFLAGVAWGGLFLLLGRGLAVLLGQPVAATSLRETALMASRLPVVSLLAAPLAVTIAVVLLGIVAPVSMLHRWKISDNTVSLILFALLTPVYLAVTFAQPSSGPAPYVLAMASAAMLTIPFILHDLLTSLLSVYVSSVYLMSFRLAVQADPELRRTGWSVLLVLGVTTVVAAIRARRPLLSEDSVRPVYAKNLLERQALEAELSAARQAQLRLLPQRFPEVAGATVAARCEPGGDVSGDYFDVLPMADGKVMFVMVDESVEGLSAALRVTLIKGLLLSLLQRQESALGLLASVIRQVRDILRDERALAMAIAIFDPVTRVAEIARNGTTPRILLVSPASATASAQKSMESREVTLEPFHGGIALTTLVLAPGEMLMMLSDAFTGDRLSLPSSGGGVETLEALFGSKFHGSSDEAGDGDRTGDRTALILRADKA